jgi:hypothetical protein
LIALIALREARRAAAVAQADLIGDCG